MIPKGRLVKQCGLFAKYWFDGLTIRYTCRTASTTTGGAVIAYVPDPTWKAPSDPAVLVTQLKQMEGAVTFPFNTPAGVSTKMTINPEGHSRHNRKDGLWTNPDDNVQIANPFLTSQGQIFIICDSNAGNFTGTMDLLFEIDYNVRFWEPVTRDDPLEQQVSTIDLGAAQGIPCFRIHPAGALDTAPGLLDAVPVGGVVTPEVFVAANQFLSDLGAMLVADSAYALTNTRIPAAAIDASLGVPAQWLYPFNYGAGRSGVWVAIAANDALSTPPTPSSGSGAAFAFSNVAFLEFVRVRRSTLPFPAARGLDDEVRRLNELKLRGRRGFN
jgi:hypothetical protein